MKSHRYVVANPWLDMTAEAPDVSDIRLSMPDFIFDELIESLYSIGRIQQVHLHQPDEAQRTYQDLVDRYGLSHHAGQRTVAALHELGKEPAAPPKAALVWGGREFTRKTWDNVLGPMGFRTHAVAQYSVSKAHLAPYCAGRPRAPGNAAL